VFQYSYTNIPENKQSLRELVMNTVTQLTLWYYLHQTIDRRQSLKQKESNYILPEGVP
jgi:hypothetical protein